MLIKNSTYFFIDESVDDNKTVFLIGCIISKEPNLLREKIIKLRENILHDQNIDDLNLQYLINNCFHYCKDHRLIKNEFIKLLNTLPFNAYILFNNITEPISFDKIYFKSLYSLLFDRISDNNESFINIEIEQNDFNKNEKVVEIINKIIKKINNNYNKKIEIFPNIIISSKKEVCFSIIDYVLAIFREYLKDKTNNAKIRDFNFIRNKIRLIHDFNNKIFYSENNPI